MTITTKAIAAAILMTLTPALASAQGYTNFGPGVGNTPADQPGAALAIGTDHCGATHFQYYVGLHLGIFPPPPQAYIVRPGTARNTQFIPDQLNFDTDGNSYVTRVYCG